MGYFENGSSQCLLFEQFLFQGFCKYCIFYTIFLLLPYCKLRKGVVGLEKGGKGSKNGGQKGSFIATVVFSTLVFSSRLMIKLKTFEIMLGVLCHNKFNIINILNWGWTFSRPQTPTRFYTPNKLTISVILSIIEFFHNLLLQ